MSGFSIGSVGSFGSHSHSGYKKRHKYGTQGGYAKGGYRKVAKKTGFGCAFMFAVWAGAGASLAGLTWWLA